jgi:hypothetical protein
MNQITLESAAAAVWIGLKLSPVAVLVIFMLAK